MPGGKLIATTTKAERPETASSAKVLLFDIESSPNIGFTWGRYEQTVIDFVKERQIISFAWKWLGEKKVHCLALPSFKGYRRNRTNNKSLILELHKIISSADIVVGHNVSNFDDKFANSEFAIHGLKPPPPHKQIDTLKVARSKFRFNSNRLGDLSERLGFGKKARTGGFELWLGCLRGEMGSWNRMMAYNKRDVVLLEKIYLKMRPWMTNHPATKPRENTNKNPECPICHERKLQSKGTQMNRKGRAPRYHCQSCGSWTLGIRVKNKWAVK